MTPEKVPTPIDPMDVLDARSVSIAQAISDAFHPNAERDIRAGGNPVRAWRLQRGWSVADLADALDVDDEDVCRIEKNMWYAFADELDRVARAFDIHPADLVAAHDAMPYDLRTVLIRAVVADDGQGDAYAARAHAALRNECVAARDALHAELALLAGDDANSLVYTLVRCLRDMARIGALDYDDVQDMYDDVRMGALFLRDGLSARRKKERRVFESYADEFSDLIYAVCGCNDAAATRSMAMLDQWQRVFGRRDLLALIREKPAFFGFKPWHHAQPKAMVNKQLMTWQQAFDRFMHISEQALSIIECDNADYAEVKRLDAAIDRLDTWWQGEHEQTLVYRATNLATIVHAVPQAKPDDASVKKVDLRNLFAPKFTR